MSNPRKKGVRRTRRAKDLLRASPEPVSKDESLAAASRQLRTGKEKSLPVVEGEQIVGTLSGPQAERRAAGFGHDPARVPVSAAMSKEAVSIREDQTSEEARGLMNHHQLDHLPVVDGGGRFLGMLHRSSLEETSPSQTPVPLRADVCPGSRKPRKKK